MNLVGAGELAPDEAATIIAGRPELEFPFVSVRGVEIGDAGVRRILASGLLRNTRATAFECCGITDASAQMLADYPWFGGLEELYLCNRGGVETGKPNSLSDAAGIALAGSPNLGNLQRLDLWRTHVGDVGFEAIIASANLPKLSTLTAWETLLTSEGAARVKAIAGLRCSVETDYDDRVVDYFSEP